MEEFIIWEAPPIIKPEFRLYYDERGNVLFYTCEKPAGKYVVIDASTYAQGRPDLKVIDGKVAGQIAGSIISKLIHNNDDGTICASEDLSIIVDSSYNNITKWKLKTHEL